MHSTDSSTSLPPPPPPRGRQLSVPALARAFVILVCLALVAVDGRNIWRSYNASLRTSELSVQNVTRSIAQHAGDTIKKADTVLFGLLGDIEEIGMAPKDIVKLQPLLAERAAQLPEMQYVSIINKDGHWILNSLGQMPSGLDFSDREYFEFHQKNSTQQPHISAPLLSRTTGDWMIPISRRINAADGSFAGVALAAIRMSYLDGYYNSFSIGNDGSILLLQYDGKILARRSTADIPLNMNVATMPFFRDRVLRDLDGIGYTASGDGIERLFSFRRLDNYPLIAIVGLSKQEALSNWRDETIRHVIGIVLLISMIALMGHYLLRQIRVRAKISVQLEETQKKLIDLNNELERLALQDALTGLANRRQFDAALKIEFKRAVRQQGSLALLMIDVDHFKRFNDEYGHPAGDRCLQAISGVIHLQRPGDLSARYGGEEFGILLPDTDLAGAIAVAQQIRMGVKTLQLPHKRNPGGVVSISVGIASIRPSRNDLDPNVLLQASDQALYTAKAKGRDQIHPDGHVVQVIPPAGQTAG